MSTGDRSNCGERIGLTDMHSDLLVDLAARRSRGEKPALKNAFLDDLKKGGFSLVVASIFIEDRYLPEQALRKALEQISLLYLEIEESQGEITLCTSYDDAVRAVKEGRIGIILSFEGVEPLLGDINLLRVFYRLGVRGVGLTWSRRNQAGDGCLYSKSVDSNKGGLTEFGFAVLEEADKLGMFVDVSHLNDEGVSDVLRVTRKPVVASHSCCRAVYGIARNLTDEQIIQIAGTGGVIGVNSCNILLAADDRDATTEKYLEHLKHIVNLVGIGHVGFGFDMCEKMEGIDDVASLPRPLIDVLGSHADIGALVDEMEKAGYTSYGLKKIGSENFLRVLMKTLR
ncbi:MAG: dipeptidase [Clostridiales Family XIII bacterium]|nr:dipeptidase [Clostridiales Family XIII bacterium]